MTRDEAHNLIDGNQHLINTAPFDSRIEFIYYTPSNGDKHDEVVKALLLGYSYEPIIAGYDDFTVNVLYADDRDLGIVFHETLDELLHKINQ